MVLFLAVLLFAMSYASIEQKTPAGEAKEDSDIKVEFERLYRAWRHHMDTDPGARESSISWGGPEGARLSGEIMKLGPTVLPYLIDKIEAGDWRLEVFVSVMTWKRFQRSEFPDARHYGDAHTEAKLFVEWWRHGRKNTPQQFEQFYGEWKEAQRQGKSEEAKEKYQLMVDLGIDILPFLVKKIEKGDKASISAVSRLTHGELKSDADIAQCTKWWKEKKQKWTMPPFVAEAKKPESAPVSEPNSTAAPK
jgi:hypothetical protein